MEVTEDEEKVLQWRKGFAAGVFSKAIIDVRRLEEQLEGMDYLQCHTEGVEAGAQFIDAMFQALANGKGLRERENPEWVGKVTMQ